MPIHWHTFQAVRNREMEALSNAAITATIVSKLFIDTHSSAICTTFLNASTRLSSWSNDRMVRISQLLIEFEWLMSAKTCGEVLALSLLVHAWLNNSSALIAWKRSELNIVSWLIISLAVRALKTASGSSLTFRACNEVFATRLVPPTIVFNLRTCARRSNF